MMIKRLVGFGALVALVVTVAACGGGSSTPAAAGGTTPGGGEGGVTAAGVASVDSLTTLPSADLSSYDSSTSAGTNVAAASLISKFTKGIGEGLKEVGNSSRAGCETNMHKQEIFRMSQTAQLDRCYPEAMEKVGLITIPTGSLAYYRVVPPEMDDTQSTGMCDDIPEQMVKEKAACVAGSEGPANGNILMRLGKIDGALQIDMCEGAAGAESHVNEATYSASGSIYTATIVRIANWGGNLEKNKITMTADLGDTGKVDDGVVTLGADGLVSATGQMSGGFGSGTITFEKVGSNSSNLIKGAFAGSFTDPFSNTSTSFTGKTYSRFGGLKASGAVEATGCSKFEFTGSMPAMRVQDMIPFNIAAADLAAFLQSFGAELGINLTLANYELVNLCPNPNFDPADPDPAIKSMTQLAAGATACPSVTNTGTECFAITNGTVTTDFGTEKTQTFTIVDNTASPYYAEVSAFDMATLSATITEPAFTRAWDCTGAFTEIRFEDLMTGGNAAAIETAMQACFLIEEKARNNDGMGGYNCGEQEQQGGINDFAETGVDQADFGLYGGGYAKVPGGCPVEISIPEMIFIDSLNVNENKYCVPMNGGCEEFTVAANVSSSLLNTRIGADTGYIKRLAFTQAGSDHATVAAIDFAQTSGGATVCTNSYNFQTNTIGGFGPAPTFGGEGGGDAPGEAGFVPTACVNAGLTTEAACMQFCQDPSKNCME